MAISFQCPECGKSYNVGEELADKKARCKCGEEMMVPETALPSDGDPMSALLDAELPPVGEEPAPGKAMAERPGAGPLQPAMPGRRKSQSGNGLLLWIGIGAGALVGMAALLVVVFLLSRPKQPTEVAKKPAEVAGEPAPSASPEFASPEDVFKANLKATAEKDWAEVIRLWTPESQDMMVGGMAAMAVRMGGDDPSIGELMGKHGIDESLWKGSSPDASRPRDRMQAMRKKSKALGAAVDDKPAFYGELRKLMEKRGEELTSKLKFPGVDVAKLKEELEQAQTIAKLVDVQIDGDTARGKRVSSFVGKEVKMSVEFRKIDGSWLLHQPDVDPPQGIPFANPQGQ